MPKGMWIIAIALFIDLLQGGISLALLGITTPLSAALGLIPIVGTLAAGAVGVGGIVLGFVINFSLSMVALVVVTLSLALAGMGTWRVFPALLGESVPFFNNLPVWTSVAVWAVYKKHKEDKAVAAKIVRGAATMAKEPAVSRAAAAQQAVSGRAVAAALRPAAKVGGEIAAAALAVALVFGALPAQAQVVPPIQYEISPETPGPTTNVTIEVQGVGSFLGDATITWNQNGKTVQQGVGARSYSFTTGAVGQKTTIEIAVDSSQGFFQKTFTFNPAKVNLLWEADTSVPLFYLGRALYSAGSSYKVVAFPTVVVNGARVVPGALSYQWSYQGESVPEASGLGRATFSRTGDQLQSGEEIGLDVYYGTARVARSALTIPAAQPRIVLYPRDALRGEVLESALPTAIQLSGPELTVQAEPYYFSNAALRQGGASYSWTLNGEEISGPDSSHGILTLRAAGEGEGAATLGVSMQNNNADQFVQNAAASLQLVFGASTGSALLNFFGL